MPLIVYVLLIFLGLVTAQEVSRRFPKVPLILFAIVSVNLVYCYMKTETEVNSFNFIKILLVSLCIVWFSALRAGFIKESKPVKFVIYLFLVVNILEAVAKDFLVGGITHYINASAGFLLVLTLSYFDKISVSKDDRKDVYWEMGIGWIVGYTIWNWTFIYINYTNFSANHLAVLAVPLLVSIFNKNMWAQTRAFTLGTYLVFFRYLPPQLNPDVYSFWKNDVFSQVFAGISFSFMAIYAMFFLWSFHLKRKRAL